MCSEKYFHLSPGAIMHISKKKKKSVVEHHTKNLLKSLRAHFSSIIDQIRNK